MNIDTAHARELNHLLREYLTEGHQDNHIRGQRPEGPDEIRVANTLRLNDGQLKTIRHLLDGRRLELPSSTFGPIRLGDDADDGITAFGEGFKEGLANSAVPMKRIFGFTSHISADRI